MLCFSIVSNLKSRKILWKIRIAFGEIYLQLQILTIRWIIEGVLAKKSWSNTIVRRFFQGIRFHTQERWSKYYLHIVSSNGSLTRWQLRHCCWSIARRYLSAIYVYNLLRLRTSNAKRKWFHTKNKQTDKPRLQRWSGASHKYTCPCRILNA